MTIITGCTILRDAKGNPGEMILHRREATQEEVDAMCRKLMDVAGRIKDSTPAKWRIVNGEAAG